MTDSSEKIGAAPLFQVEVLDARLEFGFIALVRPLWPRFIDRWPWWPRIPWVPPFRLCSILRICRY